MPIGRPDIKRQSLDHRQRESRGPAGAFTSRSRICLQILHDRVYESYAFHVRRCRADGAPGLIPELEIARATTSVPNRSERKRKNGNEASPPVRSAFAVLACL